MKAKPWPRYDLATLYFAVLSCSVAPWRAAAVDIAHIPSITSDRFVVARIDDITNRRSRLRARLTSTYCNINLTLSASAWATGCLEDSLLPLANVSLILLTRFEIKLRMDSRLLTVVCHLPVYLLMVGSAASVCLPLCLLYYYLLSPYIIGQTIIFLPCSFYLSSFFFFLFSSPNLSGRRLHVYHTSTHGVALVRI